MKTVLFDGVIFSGTGRGATLIKKYSHRILSVLKITPFNGTLNVKINTPIDFSLFVDKKLDYIIKDGTTMVDAEFGMGKIFHKDSVEECWIMRDCRETYGKDVLEIVSKDNLREKLKIEDNDKVKIEMYQLKEKKKKTPGYDVLKSIFRPNE